MDHSKIVRGCLCLSGADAFFHYLRSDGSEDQYFVPASELPIALAVICGRLGIQFANEALVKHLANNELIDESVRVLSTADAFPMGDQGVWIRREYFVAHRTGAPGFEGSGAASESPLLYYVATAPLRDSAANAVRDLSRTLMADGSIGAACLGLLIGESQAAQALPSLCTMFAYCPLGSCVADVSMNIARRLDSTTIAQVLGALCYDGYARETGSTHLLRLLGVEAGDTYGGVNSPHEFIARTAHDHTIGERAYFTLPHLAAAGSALSAAHPAVISQLSAINANQTLLSTAIQNVQDVVDGIAGDVEDSTDVGLDTLSALSYIYQSLSTGVSRIRQDVVDLTYMAVRVSVLPAKCVSNLLSQLRGVISTGLSAWFTSHVDGKTDRKTQKHSR